MASKDQIELANFIKGVHDKLRNDSKTKGPNLAWTEHLEDLKNLEKYSGAMRNLAILWEENSTNKTVNDVSFKKCAQSRIQWIAAEIVKYFDKGIILRRRKETHLLNIWYNESKTNLENCFPIDKVNVLDVGSCYNPFGGICNFNVTAIDLYPNKDLGVFKCDFLTVKISDDNIVTLNFKNEIDRLPSEYYDCVLFSLYLEYIPTSLQRIQSCEKACKLLKPEGILVIVTPDSDHVGKNAKLMKNWRYTIAKLGFLRIKFEKLNHLTCMIFRKTIDSRISEHWSKLHEEKYMTFALEIPQDKKLIGT